MVEKIKNLLSDNFIRGTFVLTVVNFLGAVLNYAVHPILARRLTIPEYGDYQALLSFVAVFGIIAGVIGTTLTKEFSVLSSRPEEVEALRRKANQRLFFAGLIIFVLVFFASGLLNKLFKISHPAVLLIAALNLIYIFPLTVNRSVLTGMQKFSSLSLSSFIDSASRLLVVILLVVILPWQLIGASFALGLNSLLAFFFAIWQIKKLHLPSKAPNFSVSLKALYPYAWLVLWFTTLTQFFFNFDMLFVKSFFDQETAGLYGALLAIGRIIYFIGGAVPTVMFPVLASLRTDTSTRRYKVLLKSLGLMAILAIPTSAFIALFPEFTIRAVVGVKYLSITQYLPAFTLVMFLLTLLTVLSQYFLALSKRRGMVVLSIAAMAELFLMIFFHNTIWQVIISLGLSFGGASLALIVLFLLDWRYERKN
jgi:O-antigen/teichoic acid export membrane protein